MTSTNDWYHEANALLKKVTDMYDEEHEIGMISPSIYETAWVSMITKSINGKMEWLFPNSFQFILDSQSSVGGWQIDFPLIDVIISTLVCLLSLKRHQSAIHIWKESKDSIAHRVYIAITFLNSKLNDWDVMTTERVAFELIVPTLLELLEAEFGIAFKFRDRDILLALNRKKMAMIDNSMIYEMQSSCHHTLEAFIGKIDFDRLVNFKCQGSFMASPSSTAAYLMNTSVWDEEAEQYLRQVIAQCKKYGYRGGVSSFWPTTIFTFSWIICNLFQNGFKAEKLDKYCLNRIKHMLKRVLTAQDGMVGFAEHFLPDADDTAKALAAIHYLGHQFSVQSLIKNFELETHFRCYHHERNPSISANCNVLITLLHVSMPEQYVDQIEKVATFICNRWWTNEGILTDKWHRSWLYPVMLVSQGLSRLLYLHDGDIPFPSLPDNLVKDKIPIVLFQIVVRILQSQSMETGFWGANGSRQETSYAVIALSHLVSLPFFELIRTQIDVAIARGRAYLQSVLSTNSSEIESEELLWIAKGLYGSESINCSYVLSALQIPTPLYSFNTQSTLCLSAGLVEKVNKFVRLLEQLPIFKNLEEWQLRAYLIEAYLFHRKLEKEQLNLFDRKRFKQDSYFEYIPILWTSANNIEQTYLSAQTIFDMMTITIASYQLDEFFDITLRKYDITTLTSVRTCINTNFDSPDDIGTNKDAEEIRNRVFKYVNFVLKHPRILTASKNDQERLRLELKTCILAHFKQYEDNMRLEAQTSIVTFDTPHASFFRWIHTIGIDHFNTPYVFAFLTCLLGSAYGSNIDFVPTSEIKYIVQDCISHISVNSRIHNDYGSLRRDREEKNLNSIFFPEFEGRKNKTDTELKQELMHISQYERKCLEVSMSELRKVTDQKLGKVMGKRLYDVIKLYYNANEIYTEIYDLKDIVTQN